MPTYSPSLGWAQSPDQRWLYGFIGLTVGEARARWAARGYAAGDLTAPIGDPGGAEYGDEAIVTGFRMINSLGPIDGPCFRLEEPIVTLAADDGSSVVEHWTWDDGDQELVANPATPLTVYAFGSAPIVCDIPTDGFGPTGPYACYAQAGTGHTSGEIAVSVGETYTWTVRHIRFSPTYRLLIRFKDSTGSTLLTEVLFPTASPGDGWITTSGSFTAPSDAVKMDLIKDNGAGANVSVLFDEVVISVPGSPPAPSPISVPQPQRLLDCNEWDALQQGTLPDGVTIVD